MLRAIGFEYKAAEDRIDKVFMMNYEEAKTFVDEYGHFPTPKENKKIYSWANGWWRKTYLNNQELHQDKTDMLTDIGFKYQSMDDRNHKLFMNNYAEAKAFFDEHGYFPSKKENSTLNAWAGKWWKDTYLKNQELHQDKADMLTDIGFVYRVAEDKYNGMFMKNYEEAKTFVDEYGHFPTQKENKKIYHWAKTWWTRTYLKNQKLYQKKANMLKAIGFEYQTSKERNDSLWMKNYNECRAFVDKYGHFPTQKENKKLNVWAMTWWKRTYLKNTGKHQKKADMLTDIGFKYNGKK